MDLLALSVGLGLVVGLLCTELFGLAASGLIVPGYLALNLTKPRALAATFVVSFATLVVVKLVSTMMLVHGRRRTAFTLLLGYVLGMLTTHWSGSWTGANEYATVGYVVPGLVALWMDKQGIAETLSALLVVSVMVRLVLIVSGAELPA
jgi:poly-gamma-glutamate biosynthesis protein PgsC/CapC